MWVGMSFAVKLWILFLFYYRSIIRTWNICHDLQTQFLELFPQFSVYIFEPLQNIYIQIEDIHFENWHWDFALAKPRAHRILLHVTEFWSDYV